MIPNAMVFPEPVGALPQTSRPFSPGGIVSTWISVGSEISRCASEAMSCWETPSDEKLFSPYTPSTRLTYEFTKR